MNALELAQQVNELTALLSKLPASDLSFASSLINQHSRRGVLTEKQIPHVAKLLARAKGEDRKQVEVGSFAGVIQLFKQTEDRLKFPKIALLVESPKCRAVTLKLAGQRSRHPGSVHVIASSADRTYLGMVHPNGNFDCRVNGEFSQALISALKELSADPIKVVTRFGKLTGCCCFCNRELSDPRSKSAGFGPNCADAYGLTQQWRFAAYEEEQSGDTLSLLFTNSGFRDQLFPIT